MTNRHDFVTEDLGIGQADPTSLGSVVARHSHSYRGFHRLKVYDTHIVMGSVGAYFQHLWWSSAFLATKYLSFFTLKCMRVLSVHQISSWCPERSEEGVRHCGTGVLDSLSATMRMLGIEPWSLKEQSMFLSSGPPGKIFFFNFSPAYCLLRHDAVTQNSMNINVTSTGRSKT